MPRRKTARRRSICFPRDTRREGRARRLRLSGEPLETRRLLSATASTSTDLIVVTQGLSLATAITDADSLSVQDFPNVTVDFEIDPTVGPAPISVSSPLPAITRPMTIDGTSEDGITSFPFIELRPAKGASITDGLDVKAAGVVIEGLSIGGFTNAIDLDGGGTTNDVLRGDYLGVMADGKTVVANSTGVLVHGGASGNLIGGSANFTGTNGLSYADRNLISGNTDAGVTIDDGASNQIEGNFIGPDASGTQALGNASGGFLSGGVVLTDGATNNVVGGTTSEEGNLISGNGESGVVIIGSGTSDNDVQGNLIGTNAKGDAALANGIDGVSIALGASYNVIGGQLAGTTPAAPGNLISGNTLSGVVIDDATGNVLQGNFIGTDASGTKALGNGSGGIDLNNSATNNVVGERSLGAGNVVAFNNGDGIVVGNNAADDSPGNSIEGNSIFANTKLGIDLGNDGVTQNTPGDHQSGPNDLQNYPVLQPYTTSGSVTGTLNAAANTEFFLDFYANATADPSGHGQGQVYLGNESVATDAQGNASFAFKFTPVPGYPVLTATATPHFVLAPPSHKSPGTSEFSQDVSFSLQATANTVSAIEGATFSGDLATFTSGESGATASDFSATILWGDGSSSAGSVAPGGGGTFQVTGKHTYADAGHDVLSVVISDDASNTVTATATAAVGDASLSATVATLMPTEGTTFSGAVATFTDANHAATAADFSAVIHWGDDNSSTGTVSSDGDGTFTVAASHAYAEAGQNIAITVTIDDRDGATSTTAGSIEVADTALSAVGTTLAVLPGNPLTNVSVATFTDANPLATAADFTATIDWGDGNSSAGSVAAGSNGTFQVSGSHTYSNTTNENITVAIFDRGGATAQASSTGEVGDPNAQFVAAAYLNVLGRPVDAAGLAYWDAQLDQGQSRTVVTNLIDHSAEYFANIIIGPDYLKYLGRQADATGLAYWVDQMQNRGLTDEELEAGFISSPEFYADAGEQRPDVSGDEAWIDALYQTFLGRQPDEQGLNYWVGQLSGGASRDQVALQFATSLERARQRISDDYFNYLGRASDEIGIDYWVGQFASGVTNEDLITDFVASSEYFSKHTEASA